MSSSERQIVREVLASMVAEAPPPIDFENLSDVRVVQTSDRPRRSPLIAALVGFATVVVVLGGVIGVAQRSTTDTGTAGSVSDATIFLVPTAIPDDLELSVAEVWPDGTGSTQIFLPPGQTTWAEGDRVVNINVTDSVKMAEASGIETNPWTADDATVFADLRQQLVTTYAESRLTFDQTTIRNKPALVLERVTTLYENTISEVTDVAIGVVVLEGNGIISEVDTHQVARDVVIAIAESLTPVTPEAFNTYASVP